MNDGTAHAREQTNNEEFSSSTIIPLMREGLTARIASSAGHGGLRRSSTAWIKALAQVKATSPDLVIVDIQLWSKVNGIDLIKEMSRLGFRTSKCWSSPPTTNRCMLNGLLRAGAHGYINKRELQEKHGRRNAQRARRSALPEPKNDSAPLSARPSAARTRTESDPIQRLSDRELEVFQLIGQGKTTGAIARQLHLSVHTIDTHREKIRHKLGVKNSAELMQRAVLWTLENA